MISVGKKQNYLANVTVALLKVTEIFSNKPLVSNGHSNAWSSSVFKKSKNQL